MMFTVGMLSVALMMFAATAVQAQTPSQQQINSDVVDVINPRQGSTVWDIDIISHPAFHDADMHMRGTTDQLRQFFQKNDIRVQPSCSGRRRAIDDLFNDFDNDQQSALGVGIKLECTCCPLRCKLTITVDW